MWSEAKAKQWRNAWSEQQDGVDAGLLSEVGSWALVTGMERVSLVQGVKWMTEVIRWPSSFERVSMKAGYRAINN